MPSTKTARRRKNSATDCSAALCGTSQFLAPGRAVELMALFKVLANDTRLRLLHALASHGELCMSSLAAALDMKPQAVSNQLQRLLDRGILASRRQGNNVYYRIVNSCVTDLLDQGLCLVEDRCVES